YGDGGALVTDSAELAERLRRLRFYGMQPQNYVVERFGHNSRLDEVQAAILRLKLRRLDDYLTARRSIAEFYSRSLVDLPGLILPTTAPHNSHAYYLYVVRHPARDEILTQLAESYDIHLSVSYPYPVHLMPGFAHLGRMPCSLPTTERLAGEIFSLPIYPSLPEEFQERVVSALRTIIDKVS
ncbi:MAG: DegT/DnrJ/EryC1/StrS family aminotransferase, partial [Angustibacter sp.]